MSGRKSCLRITFSLALSLSALAGAAQCNCAPVADCKPCGGGYTSITLRYNGKTPALVVILDNGNSLVDQLISPAEEFTITGSKRNEKFADKRVAVLVNGIANTMLGPTCAEVTIGATYGNFTVISGVTLGGSIVCCTTVEPDTTPPVITNLPGTITTHVTAGCRALVPWTEPTASDNCQLQSFTSSHKPGDSFALGTSTVVYTAVDAAGLITTASFNVLVVDNSLPVFTGGTAGAVVVSATEACSATVEWIEPSVSDECSVVLTQSHKPNDSFPIGPTEVKYTARDAAGNVATMSFTVIVEDQTKPVFTSFPENITAPVQSECSALITWDVPKVSDNCSSVVASATHEPGQKFTVGTTIVTYTARDESGNEAVKELMITVTDNRELTITNCPADIIVKTEEETPTRISWAKPEVPIACENVFMESNYEPGYLFPVGTTKVEYVASTPAGRTGTCAFNIVIIQVEKQIEVTKLLTPDGDGLNDEWIVSNIEKFRNNKVRIVDRWGGVIFEAGGYDNRSVIWNGSNRSGTPVPTGTYFYTVIGSDGENRIQQSGSIELVR